MTLQTSLVSGLNVGLKTSTLTKYGSLEPIDLNDVTIDDITARVGTPTHAVKFGGASGAQDLIGGADLIDVGAISKEVDSAALGGLCSEISGTGDRLQSTNSSHYDDGNAPFQWVFVFSKVGAYIADRNLVSKASSANDGTYLKTNSDGSLVASLRSSGGEDHSISVAGDHGTGVANVVEVARSLASFSLSTRLGTTSEAATTFAHSNIGLLYIGKIAGWSSSAAHQVGLFLCFNGAQAGVSKPGQKVAQMLGMDWYE